MINKKLREKFNELNSFKDEICNLFSEMNFSYENDSVNYYLEEQFDYMNEEEYSLVKEMRKVIDKLDDIRCDINYLSLPAKYEGNLWYDETDKRFHLNALNPNMEDIAFHCGSGLEILIVYDDCKYWQYVTFEIDRNNEWFLTGTKYVGVNMIEGVKARMK